MKNIIQKPSGRATVAESCDIAINTGTIIQNSNIEDTYLSQKAEFLFTKGNQIKVSLAADRRKEKTEELLALDSQRDSCIGALKLLTRGYMKWKHNSQPELSERVYAVIKKHGLQMTVQNYEEESALVESLLSDLELPANQEALSSLNLTELVSDLRQAQTEFSTVYRESASIEANREHLIAATQLKQEVRSVLTETINYLNAMAIANSGQYGSIAAAVAEMVNNLNQKINTRNQN
jgi:hypothetical protein